MTINTIKLDKRYTYALEWCGYVTPMYCARFLGELISTHRNKQDAIQACSDAYDNRMAEYL
jgi:hypothetical protein